jgi:hypothetical protein
VHIIPQEKRRREQQEANAAKLRARMEDEERQLLQIKQADLERRNKLKAEEQSRWSRLQQQHHHRKFLDMKAESTWMAQFEAQMAKSSATGTPLRSQRAKMYSFYRDECPPTAEQLSQMQERAQYNVQV